MFEFAEHVRVFVTHKNFIAEHIYSMSKYLDLLAAFI